VRLIQTKVRCVEGVRDTEWFVPGRETTVIFGEPGSGKKHLLLAMEALNPLYEIVAEIPFAHHPEVWYQGTYTRRVIPEKKTAVFMVFSSEPELVRALDIIDPALIETNRIEVGRRLDYSRWITFVEISASSRWSEIVEQMQQLHVLAANLDILPESATQNDLFERLVGTDRLKGHFADECRQWLCDVGSLLPTEAQSLVDHCLLVVGRAERFRLAREKVELWLPRTIRLSPEYEVRPVYKVSEVLSAQAEYDPVLSLLSSLVRKYSIGVGESEDIAEMSVVIEDARLSLQPFMPSGMAVPDVRYNGQQFVIERMPARNIFEANVFLVVTVCLLTQLVYEQKPLLLLDGFDNTLSVADTLEMIGWVQQFGRYCQLIFTTEREMVFEAHGWQALKRVGAGGLMAGTLLPG
jgi:hypothetical protein